MRTRYLAGVAFCVITATASIFGQVRADGASGSTTSAPAQTQAKPYPEGINCIWLPEIRSGYYRVLDEQHVIIEAQGKKYYLLTLNSRCFNLANSLDLVFQAHGSQLCAPGDSSLVRGDRCPIEYLEPVDSYKDGEAIVEARDAAEKAAKQGTK